MAVFAFDGILIADVWCSLLIRILFALRRSALFEMGNTRVIAAVYGPREVILLDSYSD